MGREDQAVREREKGGAKNTDSGSSEQWVLANTHFDREEMDIEENEE